MSGEKTTVTCAIHPDLTIEVEPKIAAQQLQSERLPHPICSTIDCMTCPLYKPEEDHADAR